MRRVSRTSDGSKLSSKFHKEGYMFTNTTQDTRDIEFDYEEAYIEREYPLWWTLDMLRHNLHNLPENKYWNLLVCAFTLAGIVWTIIELRNVLLFDIVYNIVYGVHSVAVCYNVFSQQDSSITIWKIFGLLVDLISFAHFVNRKPTFKMFCYFIRLHRPFWYLFSANDFNLSASVWGTTAKVYYIFMVLRICWAFIWVQVNHGETSGNLNSNDSDSSTIFLTAAYVVEQIFTGIGSNEHAKTELERLMYLGVMLSGILMVSGVAVASMSLVISLYMRSEEVFRSRYRLIIKEMDNSHIPDVQRETVETFYLMYWKKQKAVSASKLLPTFPPTMLASIYMDIYFEATQKSKVLKDLSSQFLSQLANKMQTIHYIPGDAIIKRNSKMNAMIYITYGDVELVTPEDDMTAVLRLTKGSVISPCGVAALDGFGYAHLEVRAATYCTAHVLTAETLWKVAVKYGRLSGQNSDILDYFSRHIENVKKHHMVKTVTAPELSKYKSSIVNLKRSLVGLKEAKNPDGTLLMARTDYFLQIAGCYVMRNRADASLTDESDELCLRPTFPCILQPGTSLTFAWNLFVSLLVLVIIFVYPYYMVFTPTVPLGFRSFNIMTSAIYILDLIVHLSTGDNVEAGEAITFAQTASQQMLSSWFIVDVMATFPVFQFIGDGYYAGINKLLKTGKMFRFLRELEFLFVYNSHIIRFCSYMLFIIIVGYLTAALQHGFMCNYYSSCVVANLTHGPHWEQGPAREDAVDTNIWFSLYWAMSMITFTSHRETGNLKDEGYLIYCLVVLEVGTLLMVFIMATYAATIMVTSILRDDYRGCISLVRNFLIRNHVDETLRTRFIQYLQLCWYTDKAYSMTHKNKTIFYDLPPHVYQDIVTKQRSRYIFTVPFLKYLLEDELKKVSSSARLFYTSPNEILLNTGDLVNEIYVIKKGFCEIIDPISQKTVNLIGPKNQFGILVCLLRVPAYYTVRAATHVQVFSIPRKSFKDAINKPNINNTLDYVREQPEFNSISKRIPPFTSYEPLPKPNNLMRFKLPRKHEPDHAFLQPFFRLGFLSILRYIFPRFTIRPDSTYLTAFECVRMLASCCIAMMCTSFEYMVLQFPWLSYCALICDSITHIDVIQRLLVGYYNEQGVLIYHPASTAAHYIKGAFFVDLLSIAPLEILDPYQQFGDFTEVTIPRNFVSMNRLLQLYRLPCAARILKRYVHREDCMIIFTGLPLFVALLNAVTSFVVLSSVTILYNDDGNYTIIPIKDKGGSWIDHFQPQLNFNITESAFNIHLATYYWMSYEITSTGFKTFQASNLECIVIVLLGMLIGGMMILYITVSIISVRANVNKALAEYQENMKDMVAYMEKENLDPELRKEVLAYYEYSWDKMGGVEYRHVFELCAQIPLRTDAILHIYGPTFARCPILLQSDASLLRSLGREVHSVYFPRGQTIIEKNDVVRFIYFIDYGDVNVTEYSDEVVKFDSVKLTRGSIFGNLDNVPCTNCPIQVVAASKVHILRVIATTFYEIIDDFPTVEPLMQKYRFTPDSCFIMSNQKDYYKRRITRISAPSVVRGRKGRLRVYFKDSYVQIFLILISFGCVFADIYNAGFQDNRPGFILMLYLLDVAFYLKMLMRYFLPMVVEEAVKDVLIPQRNEYLHGDFKIDIISCVPFELFSLISKKDMWLYFSLLRLNRCLRISTISEAMKRYKEHVSVNMIYATIMNACVWFVLFVHFFACLWYFIGSMEERSEPDSSWLYRRNHTHSRHGLRRHEHHDVLIEVEECSHMYLCCVYFVLITFTQNGIDDILPRKRIEVGFVIILEVLSTFIFMMYAGELTNVLHYHSFRCFSFYAKYLELQDYFKNNRVSKNLAAQINKYCQHLWRESRGMQLPKFLTKAPTGLRLKVMSAAYLHHLTRHHIFEDCDPSFLRQLVGCLKVFTYNEGMYVVKSGEITNAMYLIHKGDVQELDHNMPQGEQITRVYPAGSYFGVLQGLFENEPFTRTYQIISNSTVLTLFLDDWLYLLEHYPESRDAINAHMRREEGRKSLISNWFPVQKKLGTIFETESAADTSTSPATTEPTLTSRIGAMLSEKSSFVPPKGPLPKITQEKTEEDGPLSFFWPTKRQDSEDETKATTESTKKTAQESEEAGPSFLWPMKRQDSDDEAFVGSDAKNTKEEKTKTTENTQYIDSDNEVFPKSGDDKKTQEIETKETTESAGYTTQGLLEAGQEYLWSTKRQSSDYEVLAKSDNVKKTEEMKTTESTANKAQKSEEARPSFLWPTKRQDSENEVFAKSADAKKTKEMKTTESAANKAQKSEEARPSFFWPTKRQDSENEVFAKSADAKKTEEMKTTETAANKAQKSEEAGPSFFWPTKRQDSETEVFAKSADAKKTEEMKTTESANKTQNSKEAGRSILWPTERQDSDNEIVDARASTENGLLMIEHKEEAENIELIEKSLAHESLEPVTSEGSLGPSSTETLLTPTENIEFIEKGVAELSLENPKSELIVYQDIEEEREMISMDISQSNHDLEDDKVQKASFIDIKFQTETGEESKFMLPTAVEARTSMKPLMEAEARELTMSTEGRRKSVRLFYEKDEEESDDEPPLNDKTQTSHKKLEPKPKPDDKDKK